MTGLPNRYLQLDELHAVSDLHLGGRSGFQIFASTAALVRLIDDVAASDATGITALLINGDFIDFLAEDGATYFDPLNAITALHRIADDPAFAPIFAALQRLVSVPQRLLVVNLGNHDLELAMPWVREQLIAKLCGADVQARARLLVITDGTGFRCRVGRANVVCVHGNEVDSWNVADYEKLRRIARDIQFGLPVESWKPNAGTTLVIEVMNRIKREYPFVDLLKPETEAVLPILAALDPPIYRSLLDLAGVAGRKALDIARMRTGFLDASWPGTAAAASPRRWNMYGPRLAAGLGVPDDSAAEAALLAEVETAWRQGVQPISLVRGIQAQQLGLWSATTSWLGGRPRHEVLRMALSHLDKDRSFVPSEPDSTSTDLDELMGAEADIIVAGHTHLERSLPRRVGGGQYFNSGTWAGLIRITPEVRKEPALFKALFDLLAKGDMAALESESGLIERPNTAVAIWVDCRGATCAELRHRLAEAPPGTTDAYKQVPETYFDTM